MVRAARLCFSRPFLASLSLRFSTTIAARDMTSPAAWYHVGVSPKTRKLIKRGIRIPSLEKAELSAAPFRRTLLCIVTRPATYRKPLIPLIRRVDGAAE